MKYRLVVNVIGFILFLLSVSMIFSAGWSLYFKTDANFQRDFIAIIKSVLITFTSGVILFFGTYQKKKEKLSVRDGFAIVTLGWILMTFYSALPFYFSDMGSYTDCFFEAMSGLTTTGASILNNIESLSHGILFWRSFTHFIGGMGIIVFSIAILPLLGVGGMQLYKAEVAGPTADKLTPRIRQTAKYLWLIYLGLILSMTLILYIEGKILDIKKLDFFHSICHAFGTIGTAGFSTFNNSIAAFESSVVTWTFIIFMFLSATNFTLHFVFFTTGSFDYFKNSEFKIYIKLIFFVAFFFFVGILNIDLIDSVTNQKINLYEKLESAFFYSVSFISTTGFTFTNYMEWNEASLIVIFILLFLGGCAGSTTGGIKLVRTLLLFKYIRSTIKKIIHPNGVYPIKIGNKEISSDIIQSVLGFYFIYIIIFIFLSIIISLTSGTDFISSLAVSASTIGNIGPGIGIIGPLGNWSEFTDLTKWILSFSMLLGRLEIFTVIILFSKTYWKR